MADFYKQMPVVSTDDKCKYTIEEQRRQVDPTNLKATLKVLDEAVGRLEKHTVGPLTMKKVNVLFYLHSGISFWRLQNEVKTGKYKHLYTASWRYLGRLAPASWFRTVFDEKSTGYSVFVSFC